MKIVNVLLFLGVFFLLLNCEKKKDVPCEEDIVCSYLLVNSSVKGTLHITAVNGAVNNVGTYTVAVHSEANCTGSAVRTASFSDTIPDRSESFLSSFSSNTQYSVRAFSGATSLCSSTFSYNIDKQTVNCQISASTITCI